MNANFQYNIDTYFFLAGSCHNDTNHICEYMTKKQQKKQKQKKQTKKNNNKQQQTNKHEM